MESVSMRTIKYIVHVVVDKNAKPVTAHSVKLEKVAGFGTPEYSENCLDTIEDERVSVLFIFRDWQTNDALSPFVVPRKMLIAALDRKSLVPMRGD
jgi:hypothetical protein